MLSYEAGFVSRAQLVYGLVYLHETLHTYQASSELVLFSAPEFFNFVYQFLFQGKTLGLFFGANEFLS